MVSKKYYNKNRERILAYKREYYAKNRDKILAYNRKYLVEHPQLVHHSTVGGMRVWERTILKETIPDIYCAFMTGKTSEERGNEDC